MILIAKFYLLTFIYYMVSVLTKIFELALHIFCPCFLLGASDFLAMFQLYNLKKLLMKENDTIIYFLNSIIKVTAAVAFLFPLI